jgi:hypothetical protein
VRKAPLVADDKNPKLALFELYLATAEKVSDCRAQANSWMLSVNSAIVALYGYFAACSREKRGWPGQARP